MQILQLDSVNYSASNKSLDSVSIMNSTCINKVIHKKSEINMMI